MPAIPSYMMGALNSAYDPNLINRLYDTAGGNLSAAQGSAANRARSSAASLAYGRGLLNPSGFTTNAGSQVYSAYAPQFGQLATGKANALVNNQQDWFKNLMSMWSTGTQLEQNQQQLNNQQAGPFNYLAAFAPLLNATTGGGGSILSSLLGMG